MSDMPERIWACFAPDETTYGEWGIQQERGDTEYIRADLVAAKDAQLLAANAEITRLRAELAEWEIYWETTADDA